ncbi:MAG: hypothetical protein OXG82_05265 [Gammaproteobacteria bacterium]|nr:hypothetical protein [Gammaproteobacteria bacterium]
MRRALDAVLAVAIAEARVAARLPRMWVFVALGCGSVLAAYGYYFYAHGYFSAPMPAIAYFSPRFQAAAMNVYLLWVFLAAAAFLAFDVGQRNHRERIAEVIDCRPVSNLALMAGRLLGLLLVSWVPMLTVVLIVQLFGLGSRAAGWWLGEPVEPVAQTAFLLVDALPILAFWIALVLALAALIRNRLFVILLALAVLGLQMWAHTFVPAYLYAGLSPLSAQLGWASDIVPRFVETEMGMQRGGLALLAAAFVCIAAVAQRRADGAAAARRVAIGAVLAAVGVLAVAWATLEGVDDVQVREQWRVAHVKAGEGLTVPDVERVSGSIVIVPGDRLELDVRMALAKPTGLKTLVFSLNPGMLIDDLAIGGQAVPFSHENGLLIVDLPAALARDGTTMALRASGIPDERFAYLDSAVDWRRRPPTNNLVLLGTESAIFDGRFVALMPGTAWLPRAGVNFAWPHDFHAVDLTVELPRDWLVAGPGRREDVGNDAQRSRVRFRPEVSVSEIALLAGRFERLAAKVREGVEVELLLHPEHLATPEYFGDASDAVVAEIERLFGEADALGIPYPLGALSLVEVPSRLRGYRGGWRMQTAMAMPGVLMVKEHGLPTARFGGPSDARAVAEADDPARVKVLDLWVHTGNDVVGGADVHRGFAHNLFPAFTRASGSGGDAVNFVCFELAFRLLTGSNLPFGRDFSAHRFDNNGYFGAALGRAAQAMAAGHFGPLNLFSPYVQRHSVWTLASSTSLAELERHHAARLAEDAMLLRASSVAQAMYDGLGRAGAGAVLAELRRRFAGRTFDADDLASTALGVGADLEALLGDWLGDSGLPGYLVGQAHVVRLTDDESGGQRYQARVHIRNDETVPGVVHVSTDRWGFLTRGSGPVRVPGMTSIEVGLVLPEPPDQLWLHPYGSLNRTAIRIDVPLDLDPTGAVDQEAFVGTRSSNWVPRSSGIVVDDLDAGFKAIGNSFGNRVGALRRTIRYWEIDVDQGLPVMERRRGEWIRREVPSARGKYRHTAALVRAGGGEDQVAFEAHLDGPGRWQLDYHIPNRHLPPPPGRSDDFAATVFDALGSMDLRLESGGVVTAIAFDAGAAEIGWNKVGEFDLNHRDVRLVVSNRTDGETVVADAIRWRRIDGSPTR